MEVASKMHVNEMPHDCLLLVLEEVATRSTLSEVIQKAFVCSKWFTVVAKMMGCWKGTSLKLFHSPLNFDLYRNLVIDQTALNTADERFVLQESPDDWKEQDHLCMRQFTDTSLTIITDGLETMFSQVTNLVINTFDIDQVDVLRAFSQLTTLTLIELPEHKRIQEDIWDQLATMTTLKHFHLFHMENMLPLEVETMRPVLERLESFTLHRYIHPNRGEILNLLNPEICRRISLGRFGTFHRATEFRTQFAVESPRLVQRLVVIDTPPVPRQLNIRWRRAAVVNQFIQAELLRNPELRPEWAFLNGFGRPDAIDENREQNRLNMVRNRRLNRFFHRALNQRVDQHIVEAGEENIDLDHVRRIVADLMDNFRRGDWLPDIRDHDDEDHGGPVLEILHAQIQVAADHLHDDDEDINPHLRIRRHIGEFILGEHNLDDEMEN